MNKGRFFVFEGPSGVGKTTFSNMIEEYLNKQGIKAKRLKSSYCSIEHSLAKHIDQLMELPEKFDVQSINPVSRFMLQIGRDFDSIKRVIRPLLDEGYILLLDRYWWSAYVFGKIDGCEEDLLNPIADIYKAFSKNRRPSIIFNIQRKYSLKSNVQKWELFKDEYAYIADKEKNYCPVINIDNDNEKSNTFDTIISHIMENISSTSPSHDIKKAQFETASM